MRHLCIGSFLGLILIGVMAVDATAQESPYSEQKEMRYQFLAHNFLVDGIEQEVYLKLDTFTGQTWRFHASNPRWVPVPESTGGYTRESGSQVRYELLAHNYFDQNGEPQELFLRADMVTGLTWVYRGAKGTWRDVGQEE
jgi:hypothetical protein